MRIASIDIGTNSVLLLIVEIRNSEIIPLKEEIQIPRLGKYLSTTQNIDEDLQNKLIKILKDYKSLAEIFEVEKIICVGTAVFRKAKNSCEVIGRVKNETGINLKILSPEQEAMLTFIGGISNFQEFYDNDFIVIDIGGGSTEIIIGNLNEIKFLKSYNIGAVMLRDLYFDSFPYQFNEEHIDEKLITIFNDEFLHNNAIPIAVAGTPTTLASIFYNQKVFDEKQVDKTYLRLNFINNLITKFYGLSPQQIKKLFPSIVEGREDVILPGALILRFIIKKLKTNGCFVSARGIRYGLIVNELINYKEGFWTKVGLRKFISSF